jgi:hypothetical protein
MVSLPKERNTSAANSTIFWDSTPCCPVKINRRFEGSTGLHGVISHKIVLFIAMALRTYPTWKWEEDCD